MRSTSVLVLITLGAVGCGGPSEVEDVVRPEGFRRNMPAGWTIVSDYGMDDAPPAHRDGVYYEGQPMGDWLAQDWGSNGGGMRRISDAAALFSPGNVLEEIYPPGLSGTGPTSWYRNIPRSSKVYVSWVVKWDADFQHNNTSEKQIHFNLGSQQASSGGSYFMFQFHWDTESIFYVPSANPLYPGDTNLYANVAPNGSRADGLPVAPPQNGAWIEYEFLFDATTGTVKWWKNGVLHADHVGRNIAPIELITLDTTWGGGGNKPGTHSRYTDHITVAVGS